MHKLFLITFMTFGLILAGCGSESEETSKVTPKPAEEQVAGPNTPAYVDPTPDDMLDDGTMMTLASGLRYIDLVEGEGHVFKKYDYISYNYLVWFTDTSGTIKRAAFYDSYKTGQPYYGQIGERMIEGLTQGLPGMKEGGSRRIFMPKAMAYGDNPPFGGRPAIFEIHKARVSDELEVEEYRASYNSKEELESRQERLDAQKNAGSGGK